MRKLLNHKNNIPIPPDSIRSSDIKPIDNNKLSMPIHDQKNVIVINPMMMMSAPNNSEKLPSKKSIEESKEIKGISIIDAHFQTDLFSPVYKPNAPNNEIAMPELPKSQSATEPPKQIQFKPVQIQLGLPSKSCIVDNNKSNKILNDEEKQMFEARELEKILQSGVNADDYVLCWKCKRRVSISVAIFPEGCHDSICKDCLLLLSNEMLSKEGIIKCVCGKLFSKGDLIQVITKEKYEELINISNNLPNDLITECPSCHTQFIVEEGKVDYNVKDNKGAMLSKECAEDFSKNRIRCSQCGKDFCKECHFIPYHLGMTCKQKTHMITAMYYTYLGNADSAKKKLNQSKIIKMTHFKWFA